MLAVKRMPCLMAGVWGTCSGPIEADHAGLRGIGRKAPDSTVIPLCHYHHHSGRFPRSWHKASRREWLDAAVLHTQANALHHGVCLPQDVIVSTVPTLERATHALLAVVGQAEGAVGHAG